MKQVEIAVTGMGAVSPFGIGTSAFWDNVIANQSAVKEITDENIRKWTKVGARVPDFDVSDFLSKKITRNTDYFTQLALITADEALKDAGLLKSDGETFIDDVDRNRFGTAIGTAFGGIQSLEQASEKLATEKAKRVGPRMISKAIPNAAASTISIQYGFRGPSNTYVTACAASANAIGESAYWFFRDDVDYILAGGVDSLWSNVFLSGLGDAGALAMKGPEDFTTWSRPFDEARTGMVMGEGAGLFVLEPLERAKARGAHIYATLKGYGASNDAYHDTAPDPEGTSAALAIERALRSAQMQPEEIDYINAHATSTQAGDIAETKALKTIFGANLDHMPVSSIKGSVGHLLGAAGAIESIASIKAIETGMLPATLHSENRDEEAPLDIVPNVSRKQPIQTAMSNSFGFGGQNGIVIWQAPQG
ncbi:beta-ketoacyl-[acyl-carrier-protein] synthase family protein [Oceanobacillus locisalsi]|uniref:Beta-ketoacyl-[acyl-carrier-protein] synthase family protein n=1 Tax=Oceanobacillus locisalsi TaxID=546107 RepID=A0ABW3NBM7_9BACI